MCRISITWGISRWSRSTRFSKFWSDWCCLDIENIWLAMLSVRENLIGWHTDSENIYLPGIPEWKIWLDKIWISKNNVIGTKAIVKNLVLLIASWNLHGYICTRHYLCSNVEASIYTNAFYFIWLFLQLREPVQNEKKSFWSFCILRSPFTWLMVVRTKVIVKFEY